MELEDIPECPPLPYPMLDKLSKEHELFKSALAIGKYVAKIYDQGLIIANRSLNVCVNLQEDIFLHITNKHSNDNKICKHYGKCLEENYQQSVDLTNPATVAVIKDVLSRMGRKKELISVLQRMDTNWIEHLNSLTIQLLPKNWFSHNTTVYKIVAMCVLLFDNEGGWIFITKILEKLGIQVTHELSNYLTQLDGMAGNNMERKNSNTGKKARTNSHMGRREQVVENYKKEWKTGTKIQPGAARNLKYPSENEDDEDKDESAAAVEEVVEEEVVEEEDEAGEDDSFLNYLENADLTYNTNKCKIEIGIDSIASSSSSSSSSTDEFRIWGGYI